MNFTPEQIQIQYQIIIVTDQQIFPHLDTHCKLLIKLLLLTVNATVSIIIIGRLGMDEVQYFRNNRHKRQAQPTFIPVYFDELNITNDIEMTCEGNPQCIFDLLLTGDMDVAMNALKHEKETNLTKDTISEQLLIHSIIL